MNRRRYRGCVLAAAVIVLLSACSGASDGFPSTTRSTVGTTPSPAPATDTTATTTPPISRGAVARPWSTVPPAPTAPTAVTVDYADPIAVARAWMTQWCPSDYREPIHHNIQRATVFSTPAGKTADLNTGRTPDDYRVAVEQRLSDRCDRINATINPLAPKTDMRLSIVVSADRVHLAADVPFRADLVTTVRSMIRQPDGRWLVDVAESP